MEAIKGIFDGKVVRFIGELPKNPFRVIVIFEEEINKTEAENELVRDFSAQTQQWNFWNDAKEDIYQDYLNK